MASCPSDMLQAQEGLDSKAEHLLDGRAGSLKMHTTLRVNIICGLLSDRAMTLKALQSCKGTKALVACSMTHA